MVTDHDALVRAICDCPDDDTPRLIYADFLEETGEAERAAFVRAQVELGRTPAWEPFAVLCRTRKREWSEAGEPFRASLPELRPEAGVEWHEQPFRRGLGWRVNVGSLHEWNRIAPRLYERAPVGELYLNPPATRDDWRAFAAGDWVRHFRIIHLDGTSPVEAIRALCENPAACGITDIHFHRSSSPGLPELVEDLLATPFGKGLKGLHFYGGFQSPGALLDSLVTAPSPLERLTFHTMNMTAQSLDLFLGSPVARELQELDLMNDRLGAQSWLRNLPKSLRCLRVVRSHLNSSDLWSLSEAKRLPNLKMLDLSRNSGCSDGHAFPAAWALQGIRIFEFREVPMTDHCWQELPIAPFWPELVGLDLRGTELRGPAIQGLREWLSVPGVSIPPQLVSIQLDRPNEKSLAADLRDIFGERVVFSAPE